MQPEIQTKTDAVALTAAAAQAIRDLFAERKLEGYAFRVYVAGRSCSGLQYGMAFDNNPQATDLTFESDGVKILVDDQSLQYIQGATIDFVEDERGKGFMVDNPNNLSACSCEGGTCG